jgi:hypothetical protein
MSYLSLELDWAAHERVPPGSHGAARRDEAAKHAQADPVSERSNAATIEHLKTGHCR